MQEAAIVILNYNGEKVLSKFLPNVIAHSSYPIIVADNGSSDSSLELLELNFPQVRPLILKENFGFAGGYNRALDLIKGEFKNYILLNSDVAVSQDWDKQLVQALNQSSDIAAIQPKILSYQNLNLFDYAGAAGGFLDYLGYPYCRGRVFDTIEKDVGQYDDDCDVDWASGACFVVKSDVFHELGGFDELFFAHMEEIDLCRRIVKSGKRIRFTGQVTVYHLGGGTLSRLDPRKTYLNFRNNLLMLYKNNSTTQLMWIYAARVILDFLTIIVFCFRKKFKEAKSIRKAHLDFWKMKSKVEKEIGKAPLLLSPEKFVLFSYHLFRKRKFSQF